MNKNIYYWLLILGPLSLGFALFLHILTVLEVGPVPPKDKQKLDLIEGTVYKAYKRGRGTIHHFIEVYDGSSLVDLEIHCSCGEELVDTTVIAKAEMGVFGKHDLVWELIADGKTIYTFEEMTRLNKINRKHNNNINIWVFVVGLIFTPVWFFYKRKNISISM